MNMPRNAHSISTKVFHGLSGALIASIIWSFVSWLFSVSSKSIFWPTLILNIPVIVVLGITAFLIVKFNKHDIQISIFWLSFLGVLIAFPATFWIDVYVLKEPVGTEQLNLLRIYTIVLEIVLGLIIQGILVLGIRFITIIRG